MERGTSPSALHTAHSLLQCNSAAAADSATLLLCQHCQPTKGPSVPFSAGQCGHLTPARGSRFTPAITTSTVSTHPDKLQPAVVARRLLHQPLLTDSGEGLQSLQLCGCRPYLIHRPIRFSHRRPETSDPPQCPLDQRSARMTCSDDEYRGVGLFCRHCDGLANHALPPSDCTRQAQYRVRFQARRRPPGGEDLEAGYPNEVQAIGVK